jgi:hypothetical protein
MRRWEKEIDWMAMNSINLVYATTGMEYIFSKVSTFILREKMYRCMFSVRMNLGVSSNGF